MKVSVPKDCIGIETRDGSKFDADRRGHVDVPEHYAREVRGATTHQLGVIGSGRIHLAGGRDKTARTCPVCHFNPWDWQTRCPRDGSRFVRTEEVQ